jgi:ferredoxin-NADP reductase
MVLPLLESRKESPTVMTFRFSTAGTGFTYTCNQAVRVFLPGVDDPWGAVRTFSLSSSPTEIDEVAVTCKITDTPFKQALAKFTPGDTAEIIGPLGSFPFERGRPSVFIAGGVGITPFRGMLRYAADIGDTAPKRLLYSVRVPEERVFRSQLDAFAQPPAPVAVHYTVTRPGESSVPWTGRTGRIDTAWIREVAKGLDHPKYYIAGLPEMVEEVVQRVQGELGIPEDDVDYDVFRGY